MNAAAEILRAAETRPEHVAIRLRADAESRDLTYAELGRSVRRSAAAIRACGVVEEQRVLLLLPDLPELAIGFLGAIWAGAVPVLVNPSLRAADYGFFLGDTRARLVITTEAIAAALRAEHASLPRLWTLRDFTDARERASELADPFASHREDPAFWLYSSGTTGAPKGTVHLQKNIAHALEGFGRGVLGIAPDDVCYSTSRMFFAYGLGASLYFPLASGASVVVCPDAFAAERSWRILAAEHPTLFFAVPSVYRALLDHPQAASAALFGTRLCVSAGESLPAAIFAEWKARFAREILDGIGSTEMLHIYVSNRPGDCVPGALGRAVPGYEAKIVDESGFPVPPGEPGRMMVRGGSLAAGYWRREEATRRAFQGEWYATGDQASCDEGGVLRVFGRTDDMLKVAGQWVSPIEVENVIGAVAGVRECAVVGTPGESGLTELVACVVASEASDDGLRGRIEAALAGRLPRGKRPRRIDLVTLLPRTATGKVQRFRLREQVESSKRGG